jgi:4-hydroxy-tetrahydrodipicolinate synthase
MESFVFEGIGAAPLLPMNEDESIDFKSLGSYYRWIAGQRPTAICVNMDASEGSSLTRDEQLEVLRATLDAVDGAGPVFSGPMASFTADAVPVGPSAAGGRRPGAGRVPVAPRRSRQPAATRDGDAVWTIESVDTARRRPRKVAILTGSEQFILEAMVMGCDGALIGFAGTATEALIRMHAAVHARDMTAAYRIWDRLGPRARYCWRLPERDYRLRMKELLVVQGLIRGAAGRAPQMGVSDAERVELPRLARHAGLHEEA